MEVRMIRRGVGRWVLAEDVESPGAALAVLTRELEQTTQG